MAAAPALAGSFTLKFKTSSEITPFTSATVADYIEGGLPSQISDIDISTVNSATIGTYTDGLYTDGTTNFFINLASPLKITKITFNSKFIKQGFAFSGEVNVKETASSFTSYGNATYTNTDALAPQTIDLSTAPELSVVYMKIIKSAIDSMTFEYEGGQDPDSVVKASPELEFDYGTRLPFELMQGSFNNTLLNPHNVSPIVWSSSDEAVATVDQTGLATFVGLGETRISAAFAGNDEYEAQTISYLLQINPPAKVDCGIAFEKEEYTATVGVPFTAPLINPNNVPVYYSTYNDKTATVNKETGEVMPLVEGTTKISCTYDGADSDVYKSKIVEYRLVIKSTPVVDPLSFDNAEYTYTFSATPFDSPLLNNPSVLTGIKWESSDVEIATVSETGVVTPLAGGTVDEPAVVVIKAYVPGEGEGAANVAEASYTLKLIKGVATVSFPVSEFVCTEGFPAEWPQPVTDPEGVTLAYSSSDGDIAQPMRYTTGGYEVYTYGIGTVTITASVDDPRFTGESASYGLTIKEVPAPTFEVVDSPLNAITVTADDMPNTWMLDGTSALEEYEINLTVNEPYDSFAWVIMDYGIGFSDKARRAESDDELPDTFITKDQIAEYFDGMVYGYGNPIRIPVIDAPKADEPMPLDGEDEPVEVQPVTVVIMPGVGERYNEAGTAGYAFISSVKYDSSTAVKTIEAADGEAVYFNLQGVRVANPEKGAYVKVQNGKAAKVML